MTRENIYDKFDEIYREIPKKYRTKSLPIFIDPDLLNLYELARDDKFPTSKNEDEKKKRLQHTNFTFIPLDGMVGTGCFFITPKENFIHLLSKNKGATKIWLQVKTTMSRFLLNGGRLLDLPLQSCCLVTFLLLNPVLIQKRDQVLAQKRDKRFNF